MALGRVNISGGMSYEDIQEFTENFTTEDNLVAIKGQATVDRGAGTATFAPATTYESTVLSGGTDVTTIATDTSSSIGDRINDTNEITDVVDNTVVNPDYDTWDESSAAPSGDWYYPTLYNGKIYVREYSSPYAMWVYDIASDTWDESSAAPSVSWAHPTLYNGKIYVRGDSPYAMWVYDIASDTWDESGTAPSGNWAYPTLYNGKIYVKDNTTYAMWVYDIASDTWDESSAAPSSYWAYPTLYNGKIYVREYYSPYAMWVYDIASDTWDESSAAPSGAWAYPTLYNGKIYVRDNTTHAMWSYDIASDTWDESGTAPSVNWRYPTLYNGKIYVRGDSTYAMWVYDIASDTWDESSAAPSGSWRYPTLYNGKIYVRGDSTYAMWIYDALESTPAYDLYLTNPITVATDDVLTIYPKAYPLQRLLFNEHTFADDVEDVFTKVTQDEIPVLSVVGDVTDSPNVTVEPTDKVPEVGDITYVNSGVNEITDVVVNPDYDALESTPRYDLTLTNNITVTDGDVLPINLSNIIINGKIAELYKLKDNTWGYKVDIKDTTITTEVEGDEGSISKIQQLYAL